MTVHRIVRDAATKRRTFEDGWKRRKGGRDSGVTRVGVTTHPGRQLTSVTFFPEKKLTTFLVVALCKVMTAFLAVVVPLQFDPPSDVNSATIFFHIGCNPLDGVTRGARSAPAPTAATETPQQWHYCSRTTLVSVGYVTLQVVYR